MHQNLIIGKLLHRALSLFVWLSLLAALLFPLSSAAIGSASAARPGAVARSHQPDLRSKAPADGITIYVDRDADGASDGSSWTDAFPNLQSALDIAADGDQIWVAAGVYTPTHQIWVTDTRTATFMLVDGAQIFGGFYGDETAIDQRDWRSHYSILSGDLNGDDDVDEFTNNSENSYHVVHAGNLDKPYTRLDGFIIQGGNANSLTKPNMYGGGLFNTNNTGAPSLVNLIFYKNYAVVGGGLYNVNADALLVNVSWIGNRGDYGAAVRNIDCSPTLVNALFIGNQAGIRGGAVYNTNGEPIIKDCTIAYNSAFDLGGGVFNDLQTHLYLYNCIAWGNTVGAGVHDQVHNEYEHPETPPLNSYTEFHHALYQDGCQGPGTTCYWVSLDGDPMFMDPPGADGIIGTLDDNLHLNATSPAINAGGNDYVPQDDLDIDSDGDITELMPYDLDYARRLQQIVSFFVGRGKPPIVDLGVYEAPPILFLPLIRKISLP